MRMARDTQSRLCMAKAPKPDTTRPTPTRKELAVVLIICRPGSTETDLAAAWVRTVGPWYCADCSPELAWMRGVTMRGAYNRMLEEGCTWEKFEGVVRVLS